MKIGRGIGNWVVERKLGEGGMGEVYLARHRTLDTEAVVKVLSELLTHDERFRARFLQEAQTQAQLGHPHIAQVLDFVEQGGEWFLVIEHLPGGTLGEVIERTDGLVPRSLAVGWARQALEALDLANQKGIIHRDVKPANIWLDAYDRVKVTDFGIAMVLGGKRLTTTGQPLGTPQYMSPEQIRHPTKVDHRADVYSMGIVLYELLTGRVPFDFAEDFDVREAQVNTKPLPPSTVNATIPPQLDGIVVKALAKDPNDRFAGCGEFAKALESCLDGTAAEAAAAQVTVGEGGGSSEEEEVDDWPTSNASRNPSGFFLTRSAALFLVLFTAGLVVGLITALDRAHGHARGTESGGGSGG